MLSPSGIAEAHFGRIHFTQTSHQCGGRRSHLIVTVLGTHPPRGRMEETPTQERLLAAADFEADSPRQGRRKRTGYLEHL